MAWASARCKPQALRIAPQRSATRRKPQKGGQPAPSTQHRALGSLVG